MSIFLLWHLEAKTAVLNQIFSCVPLLHEDKYLPIIREEREKDFSELVLGLTIQTLPINAHLHTPQSLAASWRGYQQPRETLRGASGGQEEADTEASVLTQESPWENSLPLTNG